ncbi:MAG: hypothetical protein ACFFDN_00860 [Candidatus Hodarchaeota archaeon]
MSQNKTANYIIEGAYKKIKLFSEDETLEGHKFQEGLDELNEIVRSSYDTDLFIPYVKTFEFPLVIGQQSYTLSKKIGADVDSEPIAFIEFAYLQDSSINFSIRVAESSEYYVPTRVTNISTRPNTIYWDKGVDETTIVFFDLPDKAYIFGLRGGFIIPEFEAHTTLDDIPDSYIGYLKYALARQLADNFEAAEWTPKLELTYKDKRRQLRAGRHRSLVIKQNSFLCQTPYYEW